MYTAREDLFTDELTLIIHRYFFTGQPDIMPGWNLVAVDGYRATFSMGELFVSSMGEQIILADTQNGAPLARGGNIRVIVGPDNTDDRDVQSITDIEVIDLR